MTAGHLRALARARLGAAISGAGPDAELLGEGRRVVQQESSARHLDAGGSAYTSGDGDLRLCTLVDGLPLDGIQEFWGSNPHSPTQVRGIFRSSERFL